MLRHYQSFRRARTRKIQRSSWITNSLLHLPDGPDVVAQDAKVARFPEDFGWVHEFDAVAAARSAGQQAA